jgi:hypothetical protein
MPPSWRIIDPRIEKPPDGLVGLSSEPESGLAPLNVLGPRGQFVVGDMTPVGKCQTIQKAGQLPQGRRRARRGNDGTRPHEDASPFLWSRKAWRRRRSVCLTAPLKVLRLARLSLPAFAAPPISFHRRHVRSSRQRAPAPGIFVRFSQYERRHNGASLHFLSEAMWVPKVTGFSRGRRLPPLRRFQLSLSRSARYQAALAADGHEYGMPEQDADQQQCDRVEDFAEHSPLVVRDA